MTTLTVSSLGLRFLQSARDEVAAKPVHEWSEEEIQLCLSLFRKIRESAADAREEVEEKLDRGVEARSFVHEYARFLPSAEEHQALIRELVQTLSQAEDAASERLAAELRLLEQEDRALRDLLTDALSRASGPLPAIDWDRLKEELDGEFAAGRFTRFETEEEMRKGLVGDD
jgi:hypothetical protein